MVTSTSPDRRVWQQIGFLLADALSASARTSCVATQDAVRDLVDADGTTIERVLERFRDVSDEDNYVHDFLTFVVGSFRLSDAMVRATDRSRDEWLDEHRRLTETFTQESSPK